MTLRFFRILRDNPEGGGAGAAVDTGDVTIPGVVERPDHVNADEWEGLSQSEREALVETDEGEGAHQIIGDGEEVEPASAELPEDVLKEIAGEEPPTEAQEAATETPAADAGTDEAPQVDDQMPVTVSDESLLAYRPTVSDTEVPLPDVVPNELQVKLSELDEKAEALDTKFDEGEITRADLRKEERAIAREREAVQREVLQHQLQQRDVAKEEVVWKKEQAAFLSARPEYKEMDADGKGITERSEALYGALSAQVSRLLKDPASNTKTGMQLLVEADRKVKQIFGMTAAKQAAPAKATEQPAKAAVAEQKPPATQRTTKTLTNVPVAEAEQVGNPYSAIMNLKGEAYEKALEQMRPEQREAMMARM